MIISPTRKIYLLDTNVLIELAIWHPVLICENFWSYLASSLMKGEWILTDEVVKEVGIRYQPELTKWCRAAEMAGHTRKISDANRDRGLEINKLCPIIDAKSYKSIVDTHLIAFAEEHGLTVFTREKHKSEAKELNKIPDVCHVLKIDWTREPEVFLSAISYKN